MSRYNQEQINRNAEDYKVLSVGGVCTIIIYIGFTLLCEASLAPSVAQSISTSFP